MNACMRTILISHNLRPQQFSKETIAVVVVVVVLNSGNNTPEYINRSTGGTHIHVCVGAGVCGFLGERAAKKIQPPPTRNSGSKFGTMSRSSRVVSKPTRRAPFCPEVSLSGVSPPANMIMT